MGRLLNALLYPDDVRVTRGAAEPVQTPETLNQVIRSGQRRDQAFTGEVHANLARGRADEPAWTLRRCLRSKGAEGEAAGELIALPAAHRASEERHLIGAHLRRQPLAKT